MEDIPEKLEDTSQKLSKKKWFFLGCLSGTGFTSLLVFGIVFLIFSSCAGAVWANQILGWFQPIWRWMGW